MVQQPATQERQVDVAEIIVGHRDTPLSVEAVAAHFTALHPGFQLGYTVVDGEEHHIVPPEGRARLLWIDRGSGDVWLGAGYRTNEGDGAMLPPEYVPDHLETPDREALHILSQTINLAQDHQDHMESRVIAALRAIVARYDGLAYRGEMAGDIWRLLESGVAQADWIADASGSAALGHLLARSRDLGWSTKIGDGSFEPFAAGDQLLATDIAPLRVRGAFGYWWLEPPAGIVLPSPATRRLRYLKDTAGGCAPGFDAFRRLTLTWQPFTDTATQPDGINVVNSHVVHIAAEQSRTHYHPDPPVGGGRPQTEFYFVLNPTDFALRQAERQSFLHAFPDITDWARVEKIPLSPGTIVLIPPGTGHRGIDALVNVVTLPGFKPGNEVYADQLIATQTQGRGAFNPTFVSAEMLQAMPYHGGVASVPSGARLS